MSAIASKNLYDLLGNDPELDPDREPEPPTKVIDKPVQRTGKRNAGIEGPQGDRTPAGGRAGGHQVMARGDQAGLNNRADNRDDGLRNDRHSNRNRDPGEYRGRGGDRRGGRGGRGRGRGGAPRDDRHSHTGVGDQEKQAAHGWGAEDGNAEWADERAGAAIANAEAKDDAGLAPDTNSADPAFTNGAGGEGEAINEDAAAEAEDKTKSYDQYLAEQAEKRLALGDGLNVRKANEGSSQKFPEGKAFSRDPEAENFMVGGGGKSKKAKEIQDKKERLTLDGQYYAAADSGDRGGRGRGGRGGSRGRGEFRGGDRGGRGGRGRGEFRGARGGERGDRGASRGGPRGGFNATDESAFPALGA